jgi:putative transposase
MCGERSARQSTSHRSSLPPPTASTLASTADISGVDVGRDLISRVADAVVEDVREWQQRPLEDLYPVLFLALVLKIRAGGTVQRTACYLALGVTVEGERDVLGMWFQDREGAKFWMQVLNELKQRGVRDILICCVDGLKGFPEASEAIYPQTVVQTCIVHLIRHSLKYVPRRERASRSRATRSRSTPPSTTTPPRPRSRTSTTNGDLASR